jgi:protocatechuate 3,4-dioxygenase beta subunit
MMNRRDALWLSIIALGGVTAAGALPLQAEQDSWKGAADAPRDLSWRMDLAGKDEPGERLVIAGTVYRPDGKTPASGILIYAYHTDTTGVYRRNASEHRHGRFRGWLRTGADGRYEIATIRPAPYPGRSDPAHIHMTISGPGLEETSIDSILFDDDPLLTPQRRRTEPTGRGGFQPILKLAKRDGVLHGTRDILLP